MKHISTFFALTIILHHSFCYPLMVTGSVTQNIITSTSETRKELYIISNFDNYTTGGLVVTYPVGLFTLPPVVQLSVQPTAPHASDSTYVAEISANSASSTTIMVYLISTTLGIVSVAEAPNGSVAVNLLAVADPV